MNLKRLFSYFEYKGSRGYLAAQRKYEIARTVIYFAISAAVFIAGVIATGTKNNMLTIVAVLGVLPAAKSLVSAIMFCRFKGCQEADADRIDEVIGSRCGSYDMVFTSEKVNYNIAHACAGDGCVCAYDAAGKVDENAFKEHIGAILATEGYKEVVVKVYKDIDKYVRRISEMTDETTESDAGIMKVLRQITL